jgi:hypothetical protein
VNVRNEKIPLANSQLLELTAKKLATIDRLKAPLETMLQKVERV